MGEFYLNDFSAQFRLPGWVAGCLSFGNKLLKAQSFG